MSTIQAYLSPEESKMDMEQLEKHFKSVNDKLRNEEKEAYKETKQAKSLQASIDDGDVNVRSSGTEKSHTLFCS
eukprot:5155753-Lingulodinium_polyedra.AAC.1